MRTAPNELSFNTAKSWKDIYDFRQGHRTFVKSDFYEGGSFADQCGSIVSERDTARHSKMRRDLSHAFSQRSLTEQEALISGVVDDFITQLGAVGAAGVNIVDWFTMATFDIIVNHPKTKKEKKKAEHFTETKKNRATWLLAKRSTALERRRNIPGSPALKEP